MEKELLLSLTRKGYLKNKNLHFKSFKPFRIDKVYTTKVDMDEVIILKSKNKKFEYWVEQDILIPPWITHWFQLNKNIIFKIHDNTIKTLIKRGSEKAGNIQKLSKTIGMSCPSIYNLRNEKVKMISIKKLRRLLKYLRVRYDHINNKIEYTKKGKKISIIKPNFPINLSNKYGARLLGHIVSDGCIYIDKKARCVLRSKYYGCNESVHNFTFCINKIYGKTFLQKEFIRNCNTVRIGSSIVGETLSKIGAIVGHKAKIDKNVPWLIRYGTKIMKSNYLQAVFDDEGCIHTNKYNGITISRYKHIFLDVNQLYELDKLDSYMYVNRLPTGHVNKTISIKKALRIIDKKEFLRVLNSKSKLLIGESNLLDEFKIEHKLMNTRLTKTTLGTYSICGCILIRKRDSISKFYKSVGFNLLYKQNKLEELVESWTNGNKHIQHNEPKEGKTCSVKQ